MKRSKNLITKALNSVDVFEDPIHFNMKGYTALTSSLGGILSLAIIIFLTVQTFIQAIDMFNRDGPQIIQMNEFEDEPSKAYLNNTNNFVFAVAITRDNIPMDMTTNSIISFTSTYSHYIRALDGTQAKIKADIYWAPCTKANFPSPIFPETTFSIYSLRYAYCPTLIDFTDPNTGSCPDIIRQEYPNCKTPPSFDIQGTYLSIDFEFVQFKARVCNPADLQYISGLQCTSEDIDSIFDNSEISFNIYYSNTLIDPVNYNMPNKTYLDTVYWNIDPSVTTVADIFVDVETVQDYYDYFSNDKHDNRTYYSIQRDGVRELRKFHSSNLLEWNLRRSNLNHITSRRYTKVLDVVSNIGGMSELFMLLGAFIAIGYAKYKYQMILGNELYDFQPYEEKNNNVDTQSNNETSIIALTPRLPTQGQTEQSEISRLKSFFRISARKKVHATGNQTIKDYFELQKERKRVLSYGECSYFKTLLKSLFCMKNNPEEEMARKARKNVKNDLDIIKVIEKLKEIDKLKMLLLNPNQRKAFDFIEKPLIIKEKDKPVQPGSLNRIKDPNREKKVKDHQKYTADYDSLSDYAKLYMAYRTLQDDPEIGNVKYNRRLLEMISEDLRSVFRRVDKLMGPKPDPKKFETIVQKIMTQQDTLYLEEKVRLNTEKNES